MSYADHITSKPRWTCSEKEILLVAIKKDFTLSKILKFIDRSPDAIKSMIQRKYALGYKTDKNETSFVIKNPSKHFLLKSKVALYRFSDRTLSFVQGGK